MLAAASAASAAAVDTQNVTHARTRRLQEAYRETVAKIQPRYVYISILCMYGVMNVN